MYKKLCRAAGIIIYRRRQDRNELLGLKALPHLQSRSNGIYDIPKGMIDKNETPEDCARRECYEETSLRPATFTAGPHKSGLLWTWLSECDEMPTLKINPTTGQKEHLGYTWLSIDDIIENCLDYLRPSLVWAKKVLEDNDNTLTRK